MKPISVESLNLSEETRPTGAAKRRAAGDGLKSGAFMDFRELDAVRLSQQMQLVRPVQLALARIIGFGAAASRPATVRSA